MKDRISTLLFFLISTAGFAQDGTTYAYPVTNETNESVATNLYFDVHGTYTNTIKREKLNAAKAMIDINPGYATSWVTDYISAEIIATSSGKVMRAVSANDFLTSEQKSILRMADMGTDITIDVKYRCKNSITGNMDMRNMMFSVTLVPDVEAQYVGGHEQMKKYLKENAINKISEADYKQFQAAVKFTVNEAGEITDAKISKASGDKETDQLLVEAINKMPKWRPAENSNGIKVKQEFVFSVGNGGC